MISEIIPVSEIILVVASAVGALAIADAIQTADQRRGR